MTEKLPAWIALSFGLHAGLLACVLSLAGRQPEQARQVAVRGVELLIRAPQRHEPSIPAAKPKPLSTMDFLKLALPSVPRAAKLAVLDMPAPETQRAEPAAAPRLEERLRHDLPKLEALEPGRERRSEVVLEAKDETVHRAAAVLAALPRLEDVGHRRVKNLPQALLLEERRREIVSLQGLGDAAPKTPSRREALAAAEVLEEASPPPASAAPRRGLAALLPETPLESSARPAPAPALKYLDVQPAPVQRQAQAAQEEAKKKGVEIEGPLAGRRVIHYVVPPFPDWAKIAGISEAAVSIRFNVDAAGDVMPEMSVERTSGSGRLDHLAMDALQSWRFEPLAGDGAQWGIITFRFVLE